MDALTTDDQRFDILRFLHASFQCSMYQVCCTVDPVPPVAHACLQLLQLSPDPTAAMHHDQRPQDYSSIPLVMLVLCYLRSGRFLAVIFK